MATQTAQQPEATGGDQQAEAQRAAGMGQFGWGCADAWANGYLGNAEATAARLSIDSGVGEASRPAGVKQVALVGAEESEAQPRIAELRGNAVGGSCAEPLAETVGRRLAVAEHSDVASGGGEQTWDVACAGRPIEIKGDQILTAGGAPGIVERAPVAHAACEAHHRNGAVGGGEPIGQARGAVVGGVINDDDLDRAGLARGDSQALSDGGGEPPGLRPNRQDHR